MTRIGGLTLADMISIRPSTLDELLANAGEIFVDHWDEIALNKQVMVLKPHVERYQALEDLGMLLLLAAYDGDQLVGYSMNFVMPHLHYADLSVCSNDLLYLKPTHRKGRAGLLLLAQTREHAKARGARLMLWHAKPDTALVNILPRQGCRVQDVIFSEEL